MPGKIMGTRGVEPAVRVGLEADDSGPALESQFNRGYEYLDGLLPHFR